MKWGCDESLADIAGCTHFIKMRSRNLPHTETNGKIPRTHTKQAAFKTRFLNWLEWWRPGHHSFCAVKPNDLLLGEFGLWKTFIYLEWNMAEASARETFASESAPGVCLSIKLVICVSNSRMEIFRMPVWRNTLGGKGEGLFWFIPLLHCALAI